MADKRWMPQHFESGEWLDSWYADVDYEKAKRIAAQYGREGYETRIYLTSNKPPTPPRRRIKVSARARAIQKQQVQHKMDEAQKRVMAANEKALAPNITQAQYDAAIAEACKAASDYATWRKVLASL